jgi:hypothetical protein
MLIVTIFFFQDKLLSEILDLSVLHLNSTDSKVRAKFSRLLCLVPWYFTISRLTEANHTVKAKVSMRMFCTHLHFFEIFKSGLNRILVTFCS